MACGYLSARLMEADERSAKAAIYGLNRAGGRTRELEEAWIIQALVREDGMSQVEVAELLGRHKSWVCRRLALIERLGSKARDDLRVGLLSPTSARQMVRLPQGNQAEVLDPCDGKHSRVQNWRAWSICGWFAPIAATTVHPGASP